MLAYLAKRLLMAFLVALVVMTFLALLVHLVPGDPARTVLGPRASEALSQRFRAEMGLDDPIPVQVATFVARAVRGDLGRDLLSGSSVASLIGSALPHTIVLALASLGLAAVIGIPLGVYVATHANGIADRLTSILSVSLITIPSYVAGLLLLLMFAVLLDLLPATGAGDLSHPDEYFRHLILPAISLAIAWIGYIGRLVRASMLEVLEAEYIRAARAFGVREWRVRYKYALKNASIATVAVLGVGLGNLMGGAIFVEVIFARPGLGMLIFDSISSRNYPVVRGAVLVVALLFVAANLAADLLYHWLDPRIRLSAVGR